jgi:hypothetical protein
MLTEGLWRLAGGRSAVGKIRRRFGARCFACNGDGALDGVDVTTMCFSKVGNGIGYGESWSKSIGR